MEFGSFLGNDALKMRLHAAFSEDRILHSYALCGPAGSGRHTLARQMAAAMQCTGEGRLPCGVCAACRKVMGNVHPDVITVNDPEHKMISVDVIREMRADVFLRPNEGKRKIYILEQDMGEPAQNALLKILEEPPAYGAFLILTTNAEKLLPTIDNFERALKTEPEADNAFYKGMEMVYKDLMKNLSDAGVKPIECEGRQFDPAFHNAVMHEEDDSGEENVVTQELQKGYLYKDGVLRHSMVKVKK